MCCLDPGSTFDWVVRTLLLLVLGNKISPYFAHTPIRDNFNSRTELACTIGDMSSSLPIHSKGTQEVMSSPFIFSIHISNSCPASDELQIKYADNVMVETKNDNRSQLLDQTNPSSSNVQNTFS